LDERHVSLRLFKWFQPEVVNIHFPDAQIPFVLWLRRRFCFRLVVSLHGDDVERWSGKEEASDNGRWSMAGLQQLRAILQMADTVTACSGYLLNQAICLEPGVASKGRVIHNGIDPARFVDKTGYAHPRPYLFAWGRLTHKKGFDMLLEAFAQIAPQYPELDLLLAGSGDEEARLKAQMARLGLKKRVWFLGRVSADEVGRLLNGCRVAVVPSRQEPFGIVALEAMAAGAPLLATRVGGLPEFVNGTDSWLVSPTVEGLVVGLRHMLDYQPHQLQTVQDRVLRQYDWSRVAGRYEAVLNSSLNRNISDEKVDTCT